MCKLITGVIKDEAQAGEIKRIIEIQKGKLYDEHNGMSAMVLTKAGKVLVWRELLDYDKVYDQLMKNIANSVFFVLHTRTSTGGYGEENVHLFEKDGCLMAHNGTIQKFSTNHNYQNWDKVNEVWRGKEDAGKCDTLQFLEAIQKPLNVNVIEDFVDEKNFNGVAVMFERGTKKAYFIAKRSPDVITLGMDQETGEAGAAIFFSYPPVIKTKTSLWQDVFGVRVKAGEETEELSHEVADGIVGVYEMTLD